MRLGIDLLKPPALFRNMTGRGVRMVWTLEGPFSTADYSYRLTSDFVRFDNNGFTGLHAEGRGRLTPWPMRVPIRLSARAITGVGDVAGAMLANPRIEGWLAITPKLVRGDGLKLTSAKWNGKISLLIDLVTGRFEVTLSGAMQRYLIPGLGIVDVITDLKVVPGPNGKGSHVVGTAKAWVRRLDNSFFRDLTGGLPSLTTNLERGNDGIVHFTNLQIYSPKLRLSARAALPATAPSTSSLRAGRRNTGRCGSCSTAISSGRGSTCCSIVPTTRSASERCICCCCRPRPVSIIAPAAGRGSGRSPAPARSCSRTMRRR